eukprot:3803863-Rhodomonas_salina.2
MAVEQSAQPRGHCTRPVRSEGRSTSDVTSTLRLHLMLPFADFKSRPVSNSQLSATRAGL